MAQAPQFFDLSKVMKDFDPTKFADEVTRTLKNFRLPNVDVDALVASQKKNVEALTAANRYAFEGVQAVARRQAEILQETMGEAQKAMDSISKAGSPPDAAAKQAEFAKASFEKALSNMRELMEMMTKSNQEAANAINGRISESLDEVRDMALKMKTEGAK